VGGLFPSIESTICAIEGPLILRPQFLLIFFPPPSQGCALHFPQSTTPSSAHWRRRCSWAAFFSPRGLPFLPPNRLVPFGLYYSAFVYLYLFFSRGVLVYLSGWRFFLAVPFFFELVLRSFVVFWNPPSSAPPHTKNPSHMQISVEITVPESRRQTFFPPAPTYPPPLIARYSRPKVRVPSSQKKTENPPPFFHLLWPSRGRVGCFASFLSFFLALSLFLFPSSLAALTGEPWADLAPPLVSTDFLFRCRPRGGQPLSGPPFRGNPTFGLSPTKNGGITLPAAISEPPFPLLY